MNISSKIHMRCDVLQHEYPSLSLVPLYYLVCLVSYDLICIQHSSFGNRLWAWALEKLEALSIILLSLAHIFWIKSLYFHRFPYRENDEKFRLLLLFCLLLSIAQKFYKSYKKILHDVSKNFHLSLSFLNYSTKFVNRFPENCC